MEKDKRPKNDAEINIIPLLKTLLGKLWLMLLVGAVLGSAVYGVTKLTIKPTYRSGFTAYVNNQHAQNETNALSNQDLNAAQQLTKTYSYIICSNTVLTASLDADNLKELGIELTYPAFSRMVSTKIQDETELISVYVVNKDPKLAYELAVALSETAPTCMSEIVEGSSMKIVDKPVMPTGRYGPSYVRYGILGFLLGFFAVAGYAIFRFFKDDTVKFDGDLEQRFALPVLGVIPDINVVSKGGSYYYSKDNYGYGYGSSGKQSGDKQADAKQHEAKTQKGESRS